MAEDERGPELAEVSAAVWEAAFNLRTQLVWLLENGERLVPKSDAPRMAAPAPLPVNQSAAPQTQGQSVNFRPAERAPERLPAPSIPIPMPVPAAPSKSDRTSGSGSGNGLDMALRAAVSAAIPQAVPPTEADSIPALLDVVRSCQRCPMCRERTGILVGNCVERSDLMIVGDRPFVWPDGKAQLFAPDVFDLLEKMVRAMGRDIRRVACFDAIPCASAGACRFEAFQLCRPLLWTAVTCVRPRVIISLGKDATQALLNVNTPITRMRGIWQTCGGVRIMPTYHPAYLLRKPEAKREAWEDLKRVMAQLS